MFSLVCLTVNMEDAPHQSQVSCHLSFPLIRYLILFGFSTPPPSSPSLPIWTRTSTLSQALHTTSYYPLLLSHIISTSFFLPGALGSVVGNPFDVLKTRMMTAEGTYARAVVRTHIFLMNMSTHVLACVPTLVSTHVLQCLLTSALICNYIHIHGDICKSIFFVHSSALIVFFYFILFFLFRIGATLHGRGGQQPLQSPR